MGLDTTHNAWHGPYSSFMRWREAVAEAAGLPCLRLMEGYYNGPVMDGIPLRWPMTAVTPGLLALLDHSDCDGELSPEECALIADDLEKLVPLMGDWAERTQQFIDGCREASAAGETLEFR